VATAKESGERTRVNILNETKEEVVRLKQKASADIEQQKTEALAGIKGDVADISLLLAEKILNKELTADAHQGLIDSYVSKLGK
jgi:F-type H+-transporting ATPase subunit b